MEKKLTADELELLKQRQINKSGFESDKRRVVTNVSTTHLDHLNVSGQTPLFG